MNARKLTVNIAVCGRFHYHNYVRYLDGMGVLSRVYFSHRLGTPSQFGVDPGRAVNIWPKEYLVQAHGRILADRFAYAHVAYGKIWSIGALARWSPAGILHLMAHGHGLSLVERARGDGARILAEAVNTHPANRREIIAREREHWGIRALRGGISDLEQRLVDEVNAADALLVPTNTVRGSFVERGVEASKVRKLPYAANLTRFFPGEPSGTRPRSDGPLKVICVGAIGLRKGQLHLLEACRRLGKSAIELTLVGTVSTEVSALLARYDGLFTHIERVANTEMRSVLLQHDVFVMPSLEEGLAVAICEAMACGLPIVATRESGAEEVLVDGDNGYFVRSGSADELMARLSFLIDNRELLEPMGVRAAESTRYSVNWETYANQLIEMYEQLN